MGRAYYNEIDPNAAQWLRNLIAAGHIPAGDVDERSIEDVRPDELRGYAQCHFFAGIGGWPLALALAGWPSDRPVWTGSCPCQPFSAAGKGAGFADERHLWPAWQHLIAQCRPAVVFGEQVASKDAEPWIDLVHADLEGMGYAFGCVPFPAAGVGAPHIRDRTYWVADLCGEGLAQRIGDGRVQREALGASTREAAIGSGSAGRLANTDHERCDRERVLLRAKESGRIAREVLEASRSCGTGRMAHAGGSGRIGRERLSSRRVDDRAHAGRIEGNDGLVSGHEAGVLRLPAAGPTNGQWGTADWLCCTDGKWRPVEPGSFPLAHGLPGRVGRLRAYGNAIVPAQAAEFILAYAEARGLTLTANVQQVAA